MTRIADLQARFSPVLTPLGCAYGLAMRLRRAAYEAGLLLRHTAGRPCVSVGNIGWGGSGKTPLAAWLLNWAVAQGLKPALLTRGYKANPPRRPYRVTASSPWAEAGDEPLLLAQAEPSALVLVDPKRSRAAAWACANERPDLFVLDDGMQHLALRRDADLVLLRPADLGRQWGKVIPAGAWREPTPALKRATAFLVKTSSLDILELCRARLGPLQKPVFSFEYALARIRPVRDEQRPSLKGEEFQEAPFALLTAVADPEAVAIAATRWCGRPPAAHLIYPDHHPFTSKDWDAIAKVLERVGARRALCTAKDAVKLRELADERLYSLDTRLVFGPSLFTDRPFPDWWSGVWSTLRQGDAHAQT
jgi:tetraacyldisaccharide 4'-kinase